MKARLRQPEVLVDCGQWFVESDTDTDPVSLEKEPHTGSDGRPIYFGLLHTHDSQLRVNDGDYVIKFADGSLTALNPTDFAAKYEVLDAPNETKKLKAKSE